VSKHRIQIAHDLFKFSCAHMTVFPDGRKERLHGHNYYVSVQVDLADISFENLVEFAPIKTAVAELCAAWKEHTLLAERNPHFEIRIDDGVELEFELCGKRYVLPREDVLLLPIDNVAVEALSAHLAEVLVERLGDVLRKDVVLGLEVTVTESAKQGASCYISLTGASSARVDDRDGISA
jgi:6-pyruvoyltetrahydropterin/6-carboxytetrahydropterin synthase